MRRSVDSQGRTRFTATKSFDAAGRFEYRFETPEARSDSHADPCVRAAFDRARHGQGVPAGCAAGGPGQDANGTSAMQAQPYEVELTDEPLAVLPHSRVELTAQASTSLREAVVVGPDGQPVTQSLDGADSSASSSRRTSRPPSSSAASAPTAWPAARRRNCASFSSRMSGPSSSWSRPRAITSPRTSPASRSRSR